MPIRFKYSGCSGSSLMVLGGVYFSGGELVSAPDTMETVPMDAQNRANPAAAEEAQISSGMHELNDT